MRYVDDTVERNILQRMKYWEKRIKPLPDELLVYIMQVCSQILDKRQDKQ